MNDKMKQIKEWVTFILALGAVIAWVITATTDKVGTQKDVEHLTAEQTEIKGDVKEIKLLLMDVNKSQIEQAELNGQIIQYLSTH